METYNEILETIKRLNGNWSPYDIGLTSTKFDFKGYTPKIEIYLNNNGSLNTIAFMYDIHTKDHGKIYFKNKNDLKRYLKELCRKDNPIKYLKVFNPEVFIIKES